jgi:hypothetical protein
MKKVVTWIADDGEEFETEEECWAYEHRFDDALDAALFLDDDFDVIPFNLERVYESFQYIVIKDAEKARDMFWAIYNWESCFVIPKDYKNGDILSWDGNYEKYDFLYEERRELNEKIDRIEKAVSAG